MLIFKVKSVEEFVRVGNSVTKHDHFKVTFLGATFLFCWPVFRFGGHILDGAFLQMAHFYVSLKVEIWQNYFT